MRTDLLRRVERLEGLLARASCPVLLWVDSGPNDVRFGSLGPDERMVYDIYRIDGSWGEARRRITTDPSDHGRRCEPGGCLEDVIRDIHETCERRDHGECETCAGFEYLFDPGIGESG